MSRLSNYLLGGLALWLGSCTDPYEPEVVSSPKSFLVVDGFINLQGVTTIRLSRTKNLGTAGTPPAETQAAVTIEDDAGTSHVLTEQTAGTYASPALSLAPGRQYRLRLHTAQGRQYASDLVIGKATPPIDQVTWTLGNQGVQIYLNSHDSNNNTRYYRWTYDETWEFYSAFNSYYEYVNGNIQRRKEDIYHCWASAASTSIRLGSTAKLDQDVVANFPLLLLPLESVKLRIKYSILISQHAQTPEEYAYWEKLQKNTESIGGLYDPLPTQLTGNVHCLDDASEPVIGYVGAATATEQRLFISNAELPFGAGETGESGYEGCSGSSFTVHPADLSFYFSNSSFLPLNTVAIGSLLGYTGASADCTDCRRRGTNIKPSFWP